MQTASSIITHIRHLPQFKLFDNYYCYNKYISLLNPRFRKAIAFVYIKKGTLFLALSHPGVKWELNSNHDLLKSILTMLINMDEKCKKLKANKIVLFNSKYYSVVKDTEVEDTIPHYKERSFGRFNIEIHDKQLEKMFLEIKDLITLNKNSTNV
jgi:hypothetical protein